MVEFLSEAEVYLLRFAIFLLFFVKLIEWVWHDISPIIREIQKTFTKKRSRNGGSLRRLVVAVGLVKRAKRWQKFLQNAFFGVISE